MKINKRTLFCLMYVMGIISLFSCEEEIVISDELNTPEYDFSLDENSSVVDKKIYDIHQKYGTYILYSFEDEDFKRLWTAKWNKWYVPANTNENLKYVERFVSFLEESVLSKYEEEFVKNNFPYKVFLVDSLCNNSSFSKFKLVNVLSNGNNAIAISNVGVKSDDWTEKDWQKLAVDLNNSFSLFYYSTLPVKPVKFLSLRSSSSFIKMAKDPDGIDSNYNYSCYNSGYVAGWLNTYLSPKEEQDFSDYIRFLTGNTGTELTRILTRYPLMKERAIALYTFMKINLKMDLISTQNQNYPEDKLPSNFFNN